MAGPLEQGWASEAHGYVISNQGFPPTRGARPRCLQLSQAPGNLQQQTTTVPPFAATERLDDSRSVPSTTHIKEASSNLQTSAYIDTTAKSLAVSVEESAAGPWSQSPSREES